MKLLEEIVEHGEQEPENLSDDLTQLAQIARRIISEVTEKIAARTWHPARRSLRATAKG